MDDDEPTTEELRAVQARREEVERDAAEEDPTDAGELAHRRRAERAGYLEERLAEKQRSEEEPG